ncbi:glycosyltransferase family 4 protein [Candidatus Uhrbacteria bacterium]|nr:glycosyltransferase family 4 protein [Candidatus Uhrbacteria bacterium]
MTIVMIGQKGLPAHSGGIERHVEILARGLVSRGNRVIVFGRSWYVGGGRPPAGVEQVITPSIRTKHLDAITHGVSSLFRARDFSPNIIHLHGTGIALLTPLARLMHPKAKVIVTFHCQDYVLSKWGWFAKIAFRAGEWLACQASHRTIAVSETLARYCLDTYGTQTTYVSHPIPEPNPITDAGAVQAHGLTPERYFLFVGRLIPDKKAHVLVAAYEKARLIRPDLFADRPLVLVGGASWTDRYASWLCNQAARVPGVIMLGEKSGRELEALQAHAMTHVFPTASEGLSFALIEACQYRRPVIATEIPGNLEGTGGHMRRVAPNDVDALTDALIDLASQSSTQRLEMASRAHAYVTRVHHVEDRLDDLVRVYQTTLNGRAELVTFPALATTH